MISRYDELHPYEPMPLDWGQAFHTAGVRQQRQDKVEDELYKLKGLIGSINAIDEHRPFKQELDAKYYQKLSDSADKIAKGDLEGGLSSLRDTQYQFYADPIRQELENSFANRKLWQENKIKMADDYAPWEDNSYQGFTGVTQEGAPQPFRYTGMGKIQDHYKRARDMFSEVKPSGAAREWFNLTPEGSIISVKQGNEEVAQKWLESLAEVKAPDFLNTKEGTSWLKEMHYKGLDLSTPDKLKAGIQDYLVRANADRIFKKSTSGQDFHWGPQDMRENISQPELSELGKVQVNIDPSLNVSIPGVGSKLMSGIREGLSRGQAEGAVGLGPIETIPTEESYKANFTPEQKIILEKAKRAYGQEPQNDYKAAQLINKYNEFWSKTGINQGVLLETNHKKIENDNLRFLGTNPKGALQIITRPFKLIEGEGNKEATGKNIAKEYGDPEKYNMNLVATLTPDNLYFPSGKVLQITDKSGTPVATYAMGGDRSEMENNRVLHEFYKAKNTPVGKSKVKIHGEDYIIEYEPITDRTQLDEQGNPIKIGEVARITDSHGNSEISDTGVSDAIFNLYTKINKNK